MLHPPGALASFLSAPTLPAQAVDPKVDSCGPPGDQSWLCSTVYDITESTRAAEIADALTVPMRVLIILLVGFIIARLARRAIKRFVRRLERPDAAETFERARRRTGVALFDSGEIPTARRVQRAQTIGSVLRSITSAVIWTIVILTALGEVGVHLGPVLAGAGILGVAIGFGSQTLVRDFLTGLFMLFEDQYGVGDVIDAGDASGVVEGVSLRTTRLRDVQGTLWHIPNGEIKRVGNLSQQWARALLDIPVALDTDPSRATEVIKRVADDMWQDDEEFRDKIMSEPEVWGVEQMSVDRLVIRMVVQTRPLEQWNVARELRVRIKSAFDEAGIELSWG